MVLLRVCSSPRWWIFNRKQLPSGFADRAGVRKLGHSRLIFDSVATLPTPVNLGLKCNIYIYRCPRIQRCSGCHVCYKVDDSPRTCRVLALERPRTLATQSTKDSYASHTCTGYPIKVCVRSVLMVILSTLTNRNWLKMPEKIVGPYTHDIQYLQVPLWWEFGPSTYVKGVFPLSPMMHRLLDLSTVSRD